MPTLADLIAPTEEAAPPIETVAVDTTPPAPTVQASVFADPGDIQRYKDAIANGASEEEALKVGDNGVGYKGDDTTSTTDPIVALPPDTPGFAYNRKVIVSGPNGSVVARIADKGPSNRIDLNPAAALAVGHPGGLTPVTWKYAEDQSTPGNITGLSKLTPIGSGDPEADLDPATGESSETTTDSETPSQFGAGNPNSAQVVSRDDNKTTFNNGTVVYNDGTVETHHAGHTFVQVPGSKTPQVFPDKQDTTDVGMKTFQTKAAEKGVLESQFPDHNSYMKAAQIALGYYPTGTGTGEGDDAIKDLSPGDQALVKKISNYDFPIPSMSRAITNPATKRLIDAAAQYDPSFDATQYQAKQALRKDYTSGKSSQNIRSLNTAIGHLNTLKEAADGLGNSGTPAWNSFKNFVSKQSGSPNITKFDTAATAVTGELANVFKGTAGTDSEIKQWRNAIDSSQSPAQLHAAIDSAIELIGSRLNALQDRFHEGLGKPVDFDILSPQSKATLVKLGHSELVDSNTPEAPALPTQSATPPAGIVPGKQYRDAKGRIAVWQDGGWKQQ